MNDQGNDSWERYLTETAAAFSYPPTPNVAVSVAQRLGQRRASFTGGRRLAWSVLLLLLLTTILLAVPSVRATVLELLQIGAIQIVPVEKSDAPNLIDKPVKRTMFDLAGATTWQEAQAEADIPLRLPAYPATLGPPDEVFLQRPQDPGLGDEVVITVWHDAHRPDEVDLALYQIAGSSFALKATAEETVVETAVHGESAYWVGSSHWLQLVDGELQEWLFVEGNVLVWVEHGITYRLEGASTVEAAVRIAESLR
jgi:hypothetical protein